MDAKDLRTESALSDRTKDGNTRYTQDTLQQCNRNKPYQDIGSGTLGKVDAQAVRPCAVIGPDRVVPPPAAADPYLKKSPLEPWPCVDAYRRPMEHPHKMNEYHLPNRNISPRQTFQENMQRIMLPPSYNLAKMKDNFPAEQVNITSVRNTKVNIPTETKYCEVPYAVNSAYSEQKTTRSADVNVPVNTSYARSAPHGWPPSSNIRSTKPYGVPEMFQYSDPSSCGASRPMYMPGPHRPLHEEPSHVYPEPYYQEGNLRFKPYPSVKDRVQQVRYEYLGNYSAPFQASPFPTHKHELQKSIPPHPYSGYPQVPLKYLDSRMAEPSVNAYQRSINQQPNCNNVSYRNPVMHPSYASVPGNIQANKFYPYPPENPVKNIAMTRLPYDTNNKIYMDYDNFRPKPYPIPEGYYFNEGRSHTMKGQVLPPQNFSLPNVQRARMPMSYYRRDNPLMKGYEYNPHIRNFDPSLMNLHGNSNTMSRLSSQFSPNNVAMSPSDSSVSNDTSQTQGLSQEDAGYVSQSSTASRSSTDVGLHRMPNDPYGRYDYRYGVNIKHCHLPSKSEVNSNNGGTKNKKDIDVRQFLQMWNEGEDDGNENNKDINNKHINTIDISQQSSTHNQEQLYVLGLVNVPSEELAKYEHIEKVSKLPENIKGYNSIELLNQFEEAIESSKLNNYTPKMPQSRDTRLPMRNPQPLHGMNSQGMNVMPHGMHLPPRPLSPLDVEAKISQSVIHKEVGCNFEIKPCSPKILNVEIAAPVQTLLGERVIEKVSNPISVPSVLQNVELESCNTKLSEHNISPDKNLKAPSCKMISNAFNDNVKTNYSLHDLESNSGVCLASLPRLDNDCELNFPEVNQQFINANKETVITSTLKDLPPIDVASPNMEKSHDLPMPTGPDSGKGLCKLSKYRKSRNKNESEEKTQEIVPQNMRTDSVIIKNPDNVKYHDETSEPIVLSQEKLVQIPPQSPINLTIHDEERISNISKDSHEQESVKNISVTSSAIDYSSKSNEITTQLNASECNVMTNIKQPSSVEHDMSESEDPTKVQKSISTTKNEVLTTNDVIDTQLSNKFSQIDKAPQTETFFEAKTQQINDIIERELPAIRKENDNSKIISCISEASLNPEEETEFILKADEDIGEVILKKNKKLIPGTEFYEDDFTEISGMTKSVSNTENKAGVNILEKKDNAFIFRKEIYSPQIQFLLLHTEGLCNGIVDQNLKLSELQVINQNSDQIKCENNKSMLQQADNILACHEIKMDIEQCNVTNDHLDDLIKQRSDNRECIDSLDSREATVKIVNVVDCSNKTIDINILDSYNSKNIIEDQKLENDRENSAVTRTKELSSDTICSGIHIEMKPSPESSNVSKGKICSLENEANIGYYRTTSDKLDSESLIEPETDCSLKIKHAESNEVCNNQELLVHPKDSYKCSSSSMSKPSPLIQENTISEIKTQSKFETESNSNQGLPIIFPRDETTMGTLTCGNHSNLEIHARECNTITLDIQVADDSEFCKEKQNNLCGTNEVKMSMEDEENLSLNSPYNVNLGYENKLISNGTFNLSMGNNNKDERNVPVNETEPASDITLNTEDEQILVTKDKTLIATEDKNILTNEIIYNKNNEKRLGNENRTENTLSVNNENSFIMKNDIFEQITENTKNKDKYSLAFKNKFSVVNQFIPGDNNTDSENYVTKDDNKFGTEKENILTGDENKSDIQNENDLIGNENKESEKYLTDETEFGLKSEHVFTCETKVDTEDENDLMKDDCKLGFENERDLTGDKSQFDLESKNVLTGDESKVNTEDENDLTKDEGKFGSEKEDDLTGDKNQFDFESEHVLIENEIKVNTEDENDLINDECKLGSENGDDLTGDETKFGIECENILTGCEKKIDKESENDLIGDESNVGTEIEDNLKVHVSKFGTENKDELIGDENKFGKNVDNDLTGNDNKIGANNKNNVTIDKNKLSEENDLTRDEKTFVTATGEKKGFITVNKNNLIAINNIQSDSSVQNQCCIKVNDQNKFSKIDENGLDCRHENKLIKNTDREISLRAEHEPHKRDICQSNGIDKNKLTSGDENGFIRAAELENGIGDKSKLFLSDTLANSYNTDQNKVEFNTTAPNKLPTDDKTDKISYWETPENVGNNVSVLSIDNTLESNMEINNTPLEPVIASSNDEKSNADSGSSNDFKSDVNERHLIPDKELLSNSSTLLNAENTDVITSTTCLNEVYIEYDHEAINLMKLPEPISPSNLLETEEFGDQKDDYDDSINIDITEKNVSESEDSYTNEENILKSELDEDIREYDPLFSNRNYKKRFSKRKIKTAVAKSSDLNYDNVSYNDENNIILDSGNVLEIQEYSHEPANYTRISLENAQVVDPENASQIIVDDIEEKCKYYNFSVTNIHSKKRKTLKRSLSDSAINISNDESHESSIWAEKRKRFLEPENVTEPHLFTENFSINLINNNRRNSVSSFYTDENVSFCILIDDNCIIAEENEEEKICFAEVPEQFIACETSDADDDVFTELESDEIHVQNCNVPGYTNSIVLNPENEDRVVEEAWFDDVACVETVVSEEISEEVVVSATSSPINTDASDTEIEYCNDETSSVEVGLNYHSEKVKRIYGDKMCSNDSEFVDTLYRTPQMDMNKTLICKDSEDCTGYYNIETLEEVLSESNNQEQSIPYIPELTDEKNDPDPSIFIEDKDKINLVQNMDEDDTITKTQDDTVNSCESTVDVDFIQKECTSTCTVVSSSPEVSSTTEEKNSSILLKITNYGGSRIAEVNNISHEETKRNTVSCKYTENREYLNYNNNVPRPLITKAAQKYIPPIAETVKDLKVKLRLPQKSLNKLKQLKLSKEEPKANQSKQKLSDKDYMKKPKPNFEDVLKSIDEIHYKIHKEKSKKVKKIIPKVVIKKSENGSHYASTADRRQSNPDLTGQKWQPWVFLERNKFIDKMAIKNKTKAIYSHRKNTYILAESFKKYRSAAGGVKETKPSFVISQQTLNDSASGKLKYTIRLKQAY